MYEYSVLHKVCMDGTDGRRQTKKKKKQRRMGQGGGVNGNDEAKGSMAHGDTNARMGKTKRRMNVELEIGLWQCGQMKMRSGWRWRWRWYWQVVGFSILED